MVSGKQLPSLPSAKGVLIWLPGGHFLLKKKKAGSSDLTVGGLKREREGQSKEITPYLGAFA